MKNRVVSLFELDALLVHKHVGAGISHPSAAPARRHRHTAAPLPPAARAPQRPSPDAAPRTVAKAQSFDSGAPIRCEHAVAYRPQDPVPVREPADAHASAMDAVYTVEAFEEDEADDESPPPPSDDEAPQAHATAASWVSDDNRERSLPDVVSSASYTARRRQQETPAATPMPAMESSMSAQLAAVERDLAELATRTASQAPEPRQSTPTDDADDTAGSRVNERPAAYGGGHAIFDDMATGLSYATEFKLPAVQVSQMFSALDTELARENNRRAVVSPQAMMSAPVSGAPDSATSTPTSQLIQDLVALSPSAPAPLHDEMTVDFAPARASAAIDVRHSVQLVPQQTGYSCWAAGAAMVVGWRDRVSIDPSAIARATGYWAQYANGLTAEDRRMFDTWRLTPRDAQSYTVDGFAALLTRYGPLWVASAEPGPHVRVVTAMVGDGTPTGTLVHINDPWEQGMAAFRLPNAGATYTETYQHFVEKQETLARQEMRVQGIYVAHS